MCHIECPYKHKCTSHPSKCATCTRNTGKRDYYKPRRRDWYTPCYPHWQYIPTYPQWKYTWTTNTTAARNTYTPAWIGTTPTWT